MEDDELKKDKQYVAYVHTPAPSPTISCRSCGSRSAARRPWNALSAQARTSESVSDVVLHAYGSTRGMESHTSTRG